MFRWCFPIVRVVWARAHASSSLSFFFVCTFWLLPHLPMPNNPKARQNLIKTKTNTQLQSVAGLQFRNRVNVCGCGCVRLWVCVISSHSMNIHFGNRNWKIASSFILLSVFGSVGNSISTLEFDSRSARNLSLLLNECVCVGVGVLRCKWEQRNSLDEPPTSESQVN